MYEKKQIKQRAESLILEHLTDVLWEWDTVAMTEGTENNIYKELTKDLDAYQLILQLIKKHT